MTHKNTLIGSRLSLLEKGWNIVDILGSTLVARLPVQSLSEAIQPNDPPPSFTILASYHTHGSYTMDADTEVPSVDD